MIHTEKEQKAQIEKEALSRGWNECSQIKI